MSEPMSTTDLDEISTRAAHLHEYVTMPTEAEQLAGVDVPDLLAEVARLRTELEDARIDRTTAEMQRDDYRKAHKASVAERDRLAEQMADAETAVFAMFAKADEQGVKLDACTTDELTRFVMVAIRSGAES